MSFLSAGGSNARSVTVSLRAEVTGYIANMRAAGAATKQAVGEAVTTAGKAKTELRSVGTAAGLMGAAAAVGIGAAVKSAATFESKLAQIKSLLPETQRAAVPALSSATKGFAQFGISASEAADAEIELVKAGVSANDIIGGALKGSLVLAAAGQIDVADATQIAVSAMTQFNLQGKDIPHVADLLAAGADKALGSVGDLGYGLSQAGTTASQFGLSIEDTVGTLSEFAQAGLIGEKGGTTFKQMLLQLAAPTEQAQKLMDKFGLSLYDASGNMKSMPEIAGNIQSSFSKLSPEVRNNALSVIFGSRAIQGANILMADGEKINRRWIESVNDQGFAVDQAAGKMDSLIGDVDKLGASFSNFLVGLGESGQGPARELVQVLTSLVDAADALPGPVKSSGLALLGLFAIVGVGAFAMTRLIGAVAATKTNMAALGVSAKNATKYLTFANAAKGAALIGGLALAQSGLADKTGLSNTASLALMGTVAGPWGAAIGGGIGLVKDLAATNDELAAALQHVDDVMSQQPTNFRAQEEALGAAGDSLDEFKDKVDTNITSAGDYLGRVQNQISNLFGKSDVAKGQEKLDEQAEAIENNKQAVLNLGQAMDAGIPDSYINDLSKLTDVATGLQPALDSIGVTIEDIGSLQGIAEGGGVTAIAAQLELDRITGAVKAYTAAQDTIPGRTKAVTGAIGDLGNEAKSAADKADELSTALENLLGPELGLVAATDAATTGIRHLADDLAKHSRTLKGNTDAAITNRAAISDRVKLITDQLVAEARAGAGARKLSRDLKEQRDALIKAGVAADLSGKDLRAYLHQLGLTPKLISTLIENNAPDKTKDVHDYREEMNVVPDHVNTDADFDAGGAIQNLSAYVARLRAVNGYTVHTQVINTVLDRHLTSDVSAPSGKPRAGGGPIVGPGGPRDDKAGLFALSDGEFVEPTATVDYYGVNFMEALRRRQIPRSMLGLADGGLASTFHVGGIRGMADGGKVGKPFTLEDLLRAAVRPDVVRNLRDVANALETMRDQARDVTDAEDHLHNARERQRNQARSLQQVENQLDKARGKEKVDKQQVARLEDQAAHRRYVSKQADKNLAAAEKELTKQRDQLTAATEKWKQVQQELIEQAKAIADTVISQGEIFGGAGESVSAAGILAKKRNAVSDAKTFEAAIKRLRAHHLNSRDLRDLLEQGPTAEGVQAAQSLAQAPQSVINQINAAQHRLVNVGAQTGRVATQNVGGKRQSVGAGGQIINNNFNGEWPEHPGKWAKELDRKQRNAARRARQN